MGDEQTQDGGVCPLMPNIDRKRWQENKAKGICPVCLKAPRSVVSVLCAGCREIARASHKRYRMKHHKTKAQPPPIQLPSAFEDRDWSKPEPGDYAD